MQLFLYILVPLRLSIPYRNLYLRTIATFMEITNNNQRIAKNTILLYIRMLVIMLVSLYTSRIVLNVLGVVDYGIYNVVGGIVGMFTFVNGALSNSTQRYITFAIGRGDIERLSVVFTTCVQVHLIIALLITALSETVGLWFFYDKLVIPDDRIVAAMWVYQLSILTMFVDVISVPYNSVIVAHEQMGVYAVISVIEVIMRLVIVYLLMIGNFDKLILYASLIVFVQFFLRFLYTQYCSKHYSETKLVSVINLRLLKEIGKFMGWNMWGNMAGVFYNTGLNLLLNIFFGPVVNAARGVAVQVEGAILRFSNNFLMAVSPQITKLYAKDNIPEMHKLIFRSSKITFFLLLTLSMPVFMETEMILTLWLKIVPEHTINFIRILLSISILDAVARPLITAANATGNVKLYQAVIGGILLTIAPIAYLVLRLGGNPESVYIVHLTVGLIAYITRLIIIRPMIKLSLRAYFNRVITRCFYVVIFAFPLCFFAKNMLSSSISDSIIVCLVSGVIVAGASYMFGLTSVERSFINSKCITSVLRKKKQ